MTQTFSSTAPAAPDCGQRNPPIAANPRLVTNEQRLGTDQTQALQSVTLDSHSTAARRIAPSLDYMQAHLDQPITISTLSAMVRLSPSSFFELFRKVTNDTPLNWFIQARMRRACELLEQTRLPIKQIADQVGYEDPLYFSRAFKSVCGIPPTEYRARTMQKQANVTAT